MLPNTFIQNPTSDFSRGDVLETFINQLEIQKKMTSMLAMRGLQEYIRQFIQFQMFQDSLREKITELQNSLNPHQIPATRHMDDKPTKKMTPDQNDFMKATLQKMVEESFHQQSDSPSGTRSTKSFEEEPFQIKEIKGNSRNLEKRLRDSVLNGSVPKVSRTKHISKVDMCDMTRIPRKPSKCEHDIHYAGGFCKECFVRVSQQIKKDKYPANDYVSIYQQVKEKVKAIVKKTDYEIPTNKYTSPSVSQEYLPTDIISKVKVECLE